MSTSESRARVRPGLIVGHVLGWLLFALGFAAWCLVLPITWRGFEGFGVEQGLVMLWIGVYGFLAGIGTVILVGTLGWHRLLAKVVLGLYVALLAVVTALAGAE
ncbi:hypothetical protein IQ251_06815 [Saccharopolyspora sp. HNM0983]|uniref:Uncharacterized protein n=1 Tax=Saccharopolyspora montiporae TaxID=2781240 RepID=A0A929B9S1_9PSEU|nr:hypothetical protein [Saccharopolyspora sp. HNM0983]MBE9374158.1 hypothetical protein [Saccharopolyspora sp. HNM0983]